MNGKTERGSQLKSRSGMKTATATNQELFMEPCQACVRCAASTAPGPHSVFIVTNYVTQNLLPLPL